MSIKELADRILQDGRLTPTEHQELITAINSDGQVDKEENEQVNRILDMVGEGTLKVL